MSRKAAKPENRELSVLLTPYGTPACRFQHQFLAKYLEKGETAATVVTEPISTNSSLWKHDLKGDVFESFGELIEAIAATCKHDHVLAVGAIDEFLRHCDIETFFGHYRLPARYLDEIDRVTAEAKRVTSGYSGLIVADSAYLANRALISAALTEGKPVRVFNPDGDWLSFSDKEDEVYRDHASKFREHGGEEYRKALSRAETYLNLRFSGQQTDLDSPAVFASRSDLKAANPKKVLFLHVFRDANQIPRNQRGEAPSIFGSYFEWADFCLREISKNPSDWLIRVHPSSRHYDGEDQIISRLLERHGIDAKLLDGGPSAIEILEKRWPVYTHSGTIALETAVFGFRSVVSSSRHPEQLVRRAPDKESLSKALAEPARFVARELEDEQVDMAKILLYLNYKHDYPQLAPKQPQPNRSSETKFYFSLWFQLFSVMGRYLRRPTQVLMKSIAVGLINDLRGGQKKTEA
jgi:hypothetical protein